MKILAVGADPDGMSLAGLDHGILEAVQTVF